MKKEHPKLRLTDHARERMALRGITADEVNDCLRYGYRESKGRRVLHADMKTHIAIVVDWRRMRVVTAYYLSREEYQRLYDKKKQETQG